MKVNPFYWVCLFAFFSDFTIYAIVIDSFQIVLCQAIKTSYFGQRPLILYLKAQGKNREKEKSKDAAKDVVRRIIENKKIV